VIGQDTPGVRAEYVGLAAAKNAICIAWVTVSQYDGTQGGAWTGDIGYNCGQNWFEQAEFAGYIDKEAPQTDENRYVPRCTWLDEDHSENVPSVAMKFRTLAYADQVADIVNNEKACDATIWYAVL
jgi:hypothetical protein